MLMIKDSNPVVPLRTLNDDLTCPSVRTVTYHLQGFDPA